MTAEVVHKDYLGIPRMKVPWYPTIDRDLCTNCDVCVNACKHGAYGTSAETQQVIVVDPYCCEVYCESCRFQCPVGAISFPDRKGIKVVLKELRRIYPPTE